MRVYSVLVDVCCAAVAKCGIFVGGSFVPTHWDQVMVHLRREGFDHFYECGAGQQLSRMMRFWDRSARVETVAEGYPPLAAGA
jgi:hypothetical protein